MSALTVRFLVGLVIGFVLATVAATPLALLLRWLGVGL